jgi:hypothetical protein
VYSQNYIEFYSDWPTTKLLLVLTKLSIQLFFGVSAHLQGVARTHKKINDSINRRRIARLQIVARHTRIIETTFFIVSGPPKSACTHKTWSRILFGSAHRQVVARTHKVINTTVLSIGPPPRCCLVLTKKSCIRHRRRMAQGLQIVALTHKNNRQLFSSPSGPPKSLRVLKKSLSRIFDRPPPSCCSYSQKLSIQLFFLSAHLQGVARTHKKSCIRHRRRIVCLQIVAHHTRIIESTFHRIGATQDLRVLLTKKSWSRILSDGPPLLPLVPQKLSIHCF